MAETSEAPDSPRSIQRACDQCRARKIRCDKEVPCSNCRTARRKCVLTSHAPPPRTARHRILISQQYERKIDNFEARFAGIEEMLRNIKASLNHDVPSDSGGSASVKATTTTTPAVDSDTVYEEPSSTETIVDNEKNDQTFESDSSMMAHVAFASNFLEQSVTNSSLGQQLSPDIQNALKIMQRVVRMQRDPEGISYESKFTKQKQLPKGGLNQLPLPPTDIVLKLLREIKAVPPMTFITSCAFIHVDEFIDSCRKVFFATEDYTIATFITVNAGLYHLFQEKSMTATSMDEELLNYHYLCRDNIETALSNLPFFLPQKRETIVALLLSVTYSIEASKFTLAWQLNSAAAAICQTLGWHRLQATENDQDDTRLPIFWFCYTMDKGLSLRFGRPSIFQDWDMSLSTGYGGDSNQTGSWRNMFDIWIRSFRIQGETYQHLYSPEALSRPPEQRIETARLLIEKLKQLWKQMERCKPTLMQQTAEMTEAHIGDVKDQKWRATTLEMQLKAGGVTHWGALTLIYRSIPSEPGLPSTYNTQCIQAARMAFTCHHECMDLISNNLFAQAGYLHWTVLYMPFTPFIVLFCHVIETFNADDLQRLSQFTTSLQPVIPMSQSIEKLYRLCKVLYDVAILYIESKTKSRQDQDMSVVGENFDLYLSQLGFIPQQQKSTSDTNTISGDYEFGSSSMNLETANLGDWFSGNSHIMGLLEDDFLFDLNSE